MKYLIFSICLIISLSGCMSQAQKDNQTKRALCASFEMKPKEIQFSDEQEPDIICFDEETGEHVYFQFKRTEQTNNMKVY